MRIKASRETEVMQNMEVPQEIVTRARLAEVLRCSKYVCLKADSSLVLSALTRVCGWLGMTTDSISLEGFE